MKLCWSVQNAWQRRLNKCRGAQNALRQFHQSCSHLQKTLALSGYVRFLPQEATVSCIGKPKKQISKAATIRLVSARFPIGTSTKTRKDELATLRLSNLSQNHDSKVHKLFSSMCSSKPSKKSKPSNFGCESDFNMVYSDWLLS